MKIKIGRHLYEISCDDEFMDNGVCVQLITQSKEKSIWGRTPNPVLSKECVKEIYKHRHIQKKHEYGTSVKVFSVQEL